MKIKDIKIKKKYEVILEDDFGNEFFLNSNDVSLLIFCKQYKRSINNIARFLNVTPASVTIKVKKLENLGKVKVERMGKGKKTFVKTLMELPKKLK